MVTLPVFTEDCPLNSLTKVLLDVQIWRFKPIDLNSSLQPVHSCKYQEDLSQSRKHLHHVHNILIFLMVEENFLSPQVKRSVIIS